MKLLKKATGFDAEKIIVLPRYQLNEMESHLIVRETYITDIGYFPRAEHHYRKRPVGCDSHIIIYCASGEGWIKIGSDQKIRVSKQTLVFIPANEPHSYGAEETNPWSIYWFHLKGSQTEMLIKNVGLETGSLQLSLSEAETLLEFFHQCYDLLSAKAYSLPHHIHVSYTIRYLLSFIGLIPRRKQDGNADDFIENAIRYMKEKIESNLTLEDLVAYTRISKQHLNHLFRKSTGCPPIDYYLRLKMQRAGELLDLTDSSVKQISLSLGINDPYYFSRLFKKMIGVSPAAYRDHLKG
ncbi:AraC family transcriptional regulator [Bacillus sp. FJAT-28004]|uniref:AraC family transcriptional regulator n=1 Tax=Bacillus sp. FJAT-28004 TaxID=1679165 RepID=UPI0006B5F862|nr:helix-turn-helix domain-containing protein [Bacillus sp. FJAT-28004]